MGSSITAHELTLLPDGIEGYSRRPTTRRLVRWNPVERRFPAKLFGYEQEPDPLPGGSHSRRWGWGSTLLELALAVGAVGLAAGILTLAAVERRSVPWSR